MKDSNKYYQISQKSRYALRALLQLALLGGREPVGVKKLADAQDIPARFLEVILGELRQGGFVISVRGKHGGYLLARRPDQISAGQVIRFSESIRQDENNTFAAHQRLKAGDFSENWLFEQVDTAISNILDEITLDQMIRQEQGWKDAFIGNYVI